MAERIRFAGDPEIKETGSGQAPQIPLAQNVAPTSVEMLNKKDENEEEPHVDFRPKRATTQSSLDDDDDEDEDKDEAETEGPAYSRERIGSRIGEPVEAARAVDEVERELDADDVVPCLFQSIVNLQDKGIMHHWGPGMHLVPVALAGRTKKDMHFWLKRNKVRRTGPPMPHPESD